jgi:prolipoprotein diacylglyceryltransferase
VVLLVLIGAFAAGGFGRRDGRAFLVALVLYALGRALAAAAWRDAAVLGPLNAGQLLALAIALGGTLLALALPRLSRAGQAAAAGPTWPDPEARPQF